MPCRAPCSITHIGRPAGLNLIEGEQMSSAARGVSADLEPSGKPTCGDARKASFIRSTIAFCGVLAAGLLGLSGTAFADLVKTETLPGGAQRNTYSVGPLNVTTGQNRIAYAPITGADKPAVNGWITRIVPNLVNQDGSIPSSSRVMFHHGVWINNSAPAASRLFFATGEEKTNMDIPDGYGLRYRASDLWTLNHMIHNLVPDPMVLDVTYMIDFIPDGSPAAAGIQEVKPIWMDVESGIYPVFDVFRDSGGADGEFTYPQDAANAYPPGVRKNEKTMPTDGVLVGTTGHVHTGGLSTNLYLKRAGASYAGPLCDAPTDYNSQINRLQSRQRAVTKRLRKLRRNDGRPGTIRGLNRKSRVTARTLRTVRARATRDNSAYRECRATQPSVEGNRVHLFNSKAEYFHDTGPVSWDMAMYSTDDDWQVAVKAGDVLELQTTYETKIASWYESMGINVVYWAAEEGGRNPYETKVDTEGVLNHGHYEENSDHGGAIVPGLPDPRTLPDGLPYTDAITISGYSYEQGNFRLPGSLGRPPTIKQGQSFTFELAAGDQNQEIWHSVTSCKAPCNKSTGISYPIPDGEIQFDSGQLGIAPIPGGAPTVNRKTWSTPSNLAVGTYTFFCRIHPLMRGAIRVKP